MSDNKTRRDIPDIIDGRKPGTSMGLNTETKKDAGIIREELEKLSRKGKLRASDIAELYDKYGDNEYLVDEILRLNAKKYEKLKRHARKFAEKIYRKYNDGSRPLHEILNRMMKYKTEHKWSDAEYEEFRKELTYLLTGNRALEIDYNQNMAINRSRINKALGTARFAYNDEGLKIKESEYSVLSEIMSMYEKSLALHRSVFMQSLIYTDCSLVAITGEYKRDKHNASNYIHPNIACMFLPKFEIFEIQMLYANIGNIVKTRYEKRPIITEPDSLLFYEITSDPNDVVCEINSPITDLKNRYRVQINLWDMVLKLRNGNYYDAISINEFITSLNACRNNIYDNADLVYNQDEGSIMRRLLSVFSLRPTIIYTKPLYSIASLTAGPLAVNLMSGANNYESSYGMFPFNNQPFYTITSIPMITFQIPPYTDGAQPKDLRTIKSQTIWINENKTIVPKEQSIIYSKEVLIFYINRRVQRIQIKTFSNPLMFSQLPLTISSLEKLNSYPVDIPPSITLQNSEETYHLRSVVAVTETEIRQGDRSTNIITGSTGLLVSIRNFENMAFDQTYYLYDPFGASIPVRHTDGTNTGYIVNKPISAIDGWFSSLDGESKSFYQRAVNNGTIYIYAKSSGYNPTEIISL